MSDEAIKKTVVKIPIPLLNWGQLTAGQPVSASLDFSKHESTTETFILKKTNKH